MTTAAPGKSASDALPRSGSGRADANGRTGVLAAVWPYGLVLFVGLFVLLPALGDYGLWDPWEPKYAQSAREMSERGSYIVPYYRDDVRLTKPILAYWGILAGSAVFGLNEFGARIAGVCMALASMIGVFYVISTLRGRQAGILAALVLGTAPHFFFISRQAMPDVYLFTSLGSAILFLCLGLFGPDRRRDLHFGISYAAFALAVLAKGPVVAGVIYFVPLAIYTLAWIDLRRLWQPGLWPETSRVLAVGVPASLLLAGFLGTAFLFGTSPEWWGYSSERRGQVAAVREQIQVALNRFHLAELLLVLLALAAAAGATLLFRRAAPRTSRNVMTTAALAAVTLFAVVVLLAGGQGLRYQTASLLGAAACIYLLAQSIRRYLLRPELWPDVGPYLRPLGRQVLLFVGVVLVVAGPWHIGILVKQGHGYFTDFILKHNIQRAGEKINQTGVSDFYLRVLIFGLFPWSCFIPIALASLVRWWEHDPVRRYGLEIYLLVASAATFAAFSGSTTKFPHYLSPLLIPMAVLIGLTLHRMTENAEPAVRRLSWIVAAMLYLSPMLDLLRENGVKYLVGSFTVKRYVPESLEPGTYFAAILVAFAAVLFLSIVIRSRILAGGLVVLAVLFAHYTTGTFVPGISRHKTMKNLCEAWERIDPDAPIAIYGGLKHGVYFYTDYKVERLRNREAFLKFMNPERWAFAVVERKHISALNAAYRLKYNGGTLHTIDNSHFDYNLVSNRPAP